MTRVALIHALRQSIDPIEAAFTRLWPETTRAHLLDGSLSADLAREGALTPALTQRFLALARYAADTGADGILFTCSAFGPCIEACAAALAPLPVLKPNAAMIAEAVALARRLAAGRAPRIGLLASFPGTLATMPAEFTAHAGDVIVLPCLAEGALAALEGGDGTGHDRLAAQAARALAGCEVIALGQFSLARAAAAVTAATGLPVLSTPDSAVHLLRERLAR